MAGDHQQIALRSRAAGGPPPAPETRFASSSFLLTGLMYCGNCGRAMTGQSAKSGRYHYYLCGSKAKRGGSACSQRMVRREVIESALLNRTRQRLLSPENLAELVDLVNEETAALGAERAGRMESLDREITDVQRGLDRYYDSFEKGLLDPSYMSQRVAELKDRLATLQLSRAKLEVPANAPRVSIRAVGGEAVSRTCWSAPIQTPASSRYGRSSVALNWMAFR